MFICILEKLHLKKSSFRFRAGGIGRQINANQVFFLLNFRRNFEKLFKIQKRDLNYLQIFWHLFTKNYDFQNKKRPSKNF